ncbi:hypothetical protein M1P56_17815 [Streptomyces sp. HU2014]|uniref:hypothetical protein n=1 Tax=Streptomyces sp. HU2014 TaxID=2939414 RepID=UPI00200BC279|nr:hypothetical protein [Streptomyces sp. HU2014]UQI45978.1 hypothetical protein M1P56_17285 [Streptomyces sp. HU2014]UQI46070.1 hypothetical protein M1P56_17815 [Streptomyces sp. HU2014]
METDTHTTAGTSLPGDSRAQEALGAARNSIRLYGGLGALALLAVVAVAGSGHTVNTFMGVRAVLLPVAAVLLHRLATAASRGSRRAYERVRALTLILPVAIVGVDLIPGICPPWYAVTQAVCMVPVVRAAVLLRGRAPRAAFTKGR